MFGSDENSSAAQILPRNHPQGGRRPLSVINQGIVSKRGFSETNGVCGKNVGNDRPITRKFAAQIAASRNPCLEESKRPRTESNFVVWEDVPLEDSGATKDRPVPMWLEQSEVDKHQMEKEVEMEDIFEEDLVDIDCGDAKDPLAVVDYVQDMYTYYKKIEVSSCVAPEYMMEQVDINERMRAILVDWLVEVHHKFELRAETLFLTVNLIDRFLAKQTVIRKKLQLVGLVALLLACKYEEVSVPVVDDLVFISDKAYTRNEVLEMERLMLNTLQFNMSVPTPYVFMRRFLKAAQSDRKLELLSFFLIELSLVEYEMLKYPPSLMAAAAIYTAQSTLYGVGQWSKTCEWHTGYNQHQLLECTQQMVGFHGNAATGKLTGVHRKYNTHKYGYTARCEPAHYLLQTMQPQ